MDRSVLWRAAVAQAVAVGLLFALLVAAPLPEDFFREYGVAAGPAAWLLASLGAGRVVGLAIGGTVLAALVSGLTAGVLVALVDHTLGLVAGMAIFAIAASALRGRVAREPATTGGKVSRASVSQADGRA